MLLRFHCVLFGARFDFVLIVERLFARVEQIYLAKNI